MLDASAILELKINSDILDTVEIIEAALSTEQPLHFQRSGPSVRSIWEGLRNEVYDLLCTKSAKYKTERELFGVTVKPAIAALTTYLTGGFGISIAAASALASLALLLPFKMLARSWCENAKGAVIEQEELRSLQELRKGRH